MWIAKNLEPTNGYLPQQPPPKYQRAYEGRRTRSRFEEVIRTESAERSRRQQRELERESNNRQRMTEFAHRIENHLDGHPPYSPSPPGEAYREETVATVRQSSVL